jgi:hypothetical protein
MQERIIQMTTMLNKLALAAINSNLARSGYPLATSLEDHDDVINDGMRMIAKTVLETSRDEISEKMLEAGRAAFSDAYASAPLGFADDQDAAKAIFTVMINTALEES